MASVAPTINATTPEDYARRINNVKPFAKRLHIDVGDGVFTDVKTVGLSQVYDIDGVPIDLHLMMMHPESQLEHICSLEPQLVIVHFEAPFDHQQFFSELRSMDIRLGLAINTETTVEQVRDILPAIDHLVVFTGKLGHNGGEFRADCLEKIGQARAINPDLEIAVDGGVNQETGRLAVEAGANLLDVGSFIHDAPDPEIAYVAVQAIAEGGVIAVVEYTAAELEALGLRKQRRRRARPAVAIPLVAWLLAAAAILSLITLTVNQSVTVTGQTGVASTVIEADGTLKQTSFAADGTQINTQARNYGWPLTYYATGCYGTGHECAPASRVLWLAAFANLVFWFAPVMIGRLLYVIALMKRRR